MGHTASPPRRPAQRLEPRGAPPRGSAHPNALLAAEQQAQTCPGKDTQPAAATDVATEQAAGTILISLREGRAHHDAVVPRGRQTCAHVIESAKYGVPVSPLWGRDLKITTGITCRCAKAHLSAQSRQHPPRFWVWHWGVESNRRRHHLRSAGGSGPTVERATCATT